MDLDRFFRDQLIDTYAVLPAGECSAPAGFHPRDMLLSAKSLIVFGKEVHREVYSLPSREKTERLHDVIAMLDECASALSEDLIAEGFSSVPVPSFFPVRVRDGRVRGYLSLKHCAAEAGLGCIGMNTLLISPLFGNRLALGGVVTEKAVEPVRPTIPMARCLRCRKCIRACPARALGEEGVDVLQCKNVTAAVPAPIRPLFRWLFTKSPAAPLMEFLVNRIAWDAEMVCSRCLTACPHFSSPDTMDPDS